MNRSPRRVSWIVGLLPAAALLLATAPAWAGFGTDGVTCGHNTMQDAVDALGVNGGTIYVSGSISAVPGLVSIDKPVTIVGADLNCVSSASAVASYSSLGAGITLDISNSTAVWIRRVDISGNSGGSTIRVGNAGSVIVEDATISGGSDIFGGCIEAENDSYVLLFSGAVIEDCSAAEGGGVFGHRDSQVTVYSGASVRNNDATSAGGGIALAGGNATILGEVHDNTAPEGGGVSVRYDFAVAGVPGSLTVGEGGNIHHNTADSEGGGIHVHSEEIGAPDSAVFLSGTAKVEWNTSLGDGGGIYAQDDGVTVTIADSARVNDNTASGDGGGIYVDHASVSATDNALIRTNHADGLGGGVMATSFASFVAEDETLLFENRADSHGGAIAVTENASTDLLDYTTVNGNSAGGNGGGLWVDGASANIDAGPPTLFDWMSIQSNSANGPSSKGGGIALRSAVGTVTIDGVDILGNDATQFGGGLFARASIADINGGTFQTNQAASGGALAARFGSQVTVDGSCQDACSASDCTNMIANAATSGSGGAVFVSGGSSLILDQLALRDNSATVTGLAGAVTGAGSLLQLKNVLVDSHLQAQLPALVANAATMDIRNTSLVNNHQGAHYGPGSSGPFHRNVSALNTVDNQFDVAISGNCNVAPTAAGNPNGGNNVVGVPSFGICYQSPIVADPLVTDACGAGAAVDILGAARGPVFFDRGAFERP